MTRRRPNAVPAEPARLASPPALFAYGTLTLPEVMHAVTGLQPAGQPVRLDGYACYLLRGHPYPGIRPLAEAYTEGVLYGGLDSEAWRRLDAFEDDDCYHKSVVTVRDAAGGQCQAVAYVVKEDYYPALSATPWSAQRFRDDGLDAFLAAIGRDRLDRR